MQLTEFITDLINDGNVVVAQKVVPFTEDDKADASVMLERMHQEDRWHLPGQAPQFASEAALWAAIFLYRAIQVTMIRSISSEEVDQLLEDFTAEKTPEVIYSADLCLRHLPQLFGLAKGLAPDDRLVVRLREAAQQWPLSSIGMKTDDSIAPDKAWTHESLRQLYVDRLVKSQHHQRIVNAEIADAVEAELGQHQQELWPHYEPQTTQE